MDVYYENVWGGNGNGVLCISTHKYLDEESNFCIVITTKINLFINKILRLCLILLQLNITALFCNIFFFNICL